MINLLKIVIDKMKEWVKVHTFLASILSSIIASVILSIFGYFFAIKPIQNLGENFNILSQNINSLTTMTNEVNSQMEGLQ